MGAIRTVWHVLFVEALKERRPPGFEVQAEVPLSNDPLRVDVLLLRREGPERRDREARILAGVWPLIEREAIVEYKSPARPFRRGDAYRLLSYGAQYEAEHVDRLAKGELALILAVGRRTEAVMEELGRLGCWLEPHSKACSRIAGTHWPAWVVELGSDDDGLLRMLGTGKIEEDMALMRWCYSHLRGPAKELQMSQLEGYDDIVKQMLASLSPKQRLEGLSPEERLEGLSPEEILSRLSPEEILSRVSPEERLAGILSLSDDILRQLPKSVLESLPEHVRDRIRARLKQ